MSALLEMPRVIRRTQPRHLFGEIAEQLALATGGKTYMFSEHPHCMTLAELDDFEQRVLALLAEKREAIR